MTTTTRTAFFVLTAVASISTALLANTTTADAEPGYYRGGARNGAMHNSRPNAYRAGPRGNFAGYDGGWRRSNGGMYVPRPHYRPHYGQPAYTAPAYAAPRHAAPAYAAPQPNCLRKEYTRDNQLVMRDICTNEVLSGPVGMPDQSQQPAPVDQPSQQPAPVDQPSQEPATVDQPSQEPATADQPSQEPATADQQPPTPEQTQPQAQRRPSPARAKGG